MEGKLEYSAVSAVSACFFIQSPLVQRLSALEAGEGGWDEESGCGPTCQLACFAPVHRLDIWEFLERLYNYFAKIEVLHIQMETRKSTIWILTITVTSTSLAGGV